jgi:ribosome biogenesis GTPase A
MEKVGDLNFYLKRPNDSFQAKRKEIKKKHAKKMEKIRKQIRRTRRLRAEQQAQDRREFQEQRSRLERQSAMRHAKAMEESRERNRQIEQQYAQQQARKMKEFQEENRRFQERNAKTVAEAREKNYRLQQNCDKVREDMKHMEIGSYGDLGRHEGRAAQAGADLAKRTKRVSMPRLSFGFFGITSTGKSTMINTLVGSEVAETGEGETTMKVQRYDAPGLSLWDMPGCNDDTSYFQEHHMAISKSLTGMIAPFSRKTIQ